MAENFSVDNFVGSIKASGARSNLFSCTLTAPDLASDFGVKFNTVAADKLDFLVNATVMPGYINGEIPISYYGRQVFFAGDTTFGDWTCTILNDESMLVRTNIEAWMEAINSAEGNKRAWAIPHASMLGSVTIKSYSLTGDMKVIDSMVLHGVWPNNVSPIELSHDSVNTIETFTATWQYSYSSPLISTSKNKVEDINKTDGGSVTGG
tara:strand:+ start:817 stop:1440 length:624 start_codon:yes stop_codon:yes gene_type:complete